IDGGVFKNHTAPYVEGVVLYGASGTLSVKNATFSNNTNVENSGVKATASVLYVKDCNTTVENSHFDNNKSSGGGTIFLNGQGGFSMVGGSMTNNTSPAGAPAFRVSSNFNSPERKITLKDVSFKNNVSNGGFGGAVAIYKNTNADFTNCQFIENYTTNRAGAFFVSGEDEATNTVTLDSCTFRGNYAQDGAGALEVSNRGNLGYSTYNGFGDAGNVIANSLADVVAYETCKVNLVVKNSTFTQNHTTQTGGGAIGCQTSGTVQIQKCNFIGNYTDNNYTYASGGAISIAAGNVGKSVSAGVIQDPVEGDFSIEGCLFDGNYTKGNGGGYLKDLGGAIVIQRGTKVGSGDNTKYAISKTWTKIFQCTFRNNHSNQGGALAILSDGSRTYLSNCLFYKNYVTYAIGPDIHRHRDVDNNGGGLFINNTTLYGSWSQGGWNGARINLYGGDFVFANSTIIGTSLGKDAKPDGDLTVEGLIRFDQVTDGSKIHFINSIVCNTNTKGYAFTGYSAEVNLVNDSPTSGSRGFMTTLASGYTSDIAHPLLMKLPNEMQAGSSIGGSTLQAYGTTTYLPQLKWNCDENNPTYKNSYWSWNGIPKSGYGYASMLYNMNNDLKNTAPDFYAWLVSKEVVSESTASTASWGKDQRMELRGNQSVTDKSKHITFPGAYDAGTRNN
ncbi:MAG: hypothetical protein IIX64_06495, partial [Bacteroidales bacterium]|nr:hypothetical protein [Bacteroidales bacterium]